MIINKEHFSEFIDQCIGAKYWYRINENYRLSSFNEYLVHITIFKNDNFIYANTMLSDASRDLTNYLQDMMDNAILMEMELEF